MPTARFWAGSDSRLLSWVRFPDIVSFKSRGANTKVLGCVVLEEYFSKG